jgi:lipopolysaccharide export system ATP-binding protein
MSLVADGLVKAYGGRRVVDGVSVTVERGEIVGLLGPNGAGKTTSFYMMIGLVRAEAGTVRLDGQDLAHLPMHARCRQGLGYLAQEPSVFRKLSVRDNLMLILELQGLSAAKRRSKSDELLGRLGLSHLADRKGILLSGGERRRVEIARALCTDPAFILLDEPFTGVDPIAIEEIQSIISDLKNDNIGILITDHAVRETLVVTDRAYIINNGRIFRAGSPEALARDPEVRRVYLGDSFTLRV